MMHKSLVALDASLIHGRVAALLIGGEQTTNGLPRLDVAVLAVKSVVDRGDRAGRSGAMPAEPRFICHPTEREDQSDDQGNHRTVCGERRPMRRPKLLQALDSRVCPPMVGLLDSDRAGDPDCSSQDQVGIESDDDEAVVCR